MTQFYSRIDTKFNGDVYNIPFSYSKESEISVYLDDELFTGWYFLNESQIKFAELPSKTPEIVTIRRTTDITKKVVEYTNNTMLSKEALNLSQDQLLNAVQEIYDNNIQFEIDTIQTIKDNQEEIIDTLEENRQEILDIQDTYEQESDAKFVAYQDELNTKFETVLEAAEKVNALEEAVNTAVEAATTASEQANIAINKTDETTELVEQANTIIQGTIQDFTENIDSKISTNNENMQSVLAETEAVLQEAKDTLYNTLNKSQITNCITEKPQRIKYTLENGTLTIKAGSVVIVPYGVTNRTSEFPVGSRFLHDNFKVYDTQFDNSKFFVWAELQNDISASVPNKAYTFFLCCVPAQNSFGYRMETFYCFSGDTSKILENGYGYLYNTTNNNIEYYHNSTLITPNISFPIMLCTSGNNAFSSVDKVFNGMGRIGSCQWYDKDIVGLSPNGLNPDGTYKNIEVRRTKLTVRDFAGSGTGSIGYVWLLSTAGHRDNVDYYVQDTQPELSGNWCWYDTLNNKLYTYSSSAGLRDVSGHFIAGFGHRTNTVIDELNPKQPFRAVDYSDKAEVSGWSMPSNKYVDLTLGASGTTYTAPANGWFALSVLGLNGSTSMIRLQNNTNGICSYCTSPASGTATAGATVPVLKGDVVTLGLYGTYTEVHALRFVYAQGEV